MHRFQMHWGCLRQAVVIYQRLLGCNFQLFSGCSAGKTAVPGLEPLYSQTVHSWAEKPDRIFATVKSGTGLTWLGFPIYNWTKICNKYRKHWKSYLSCQVADQADLGTTKNFCNFAKVSYFWGFLVCFYKVQLFWEGHKNLHNLPYGFDVYQCMEIPLDGANTVDS